MVAALLALTLSPGCTVSSASQPAPSAAVGQAAPAFTLTDLHGAEVSLADFTGKTVVLEWFNPGCPFVKYAHGEGPLASQAAKTVSDEVVWLAVNSGAPGKEGHGLKTNRDAAAEWNMSHPVLIDEDGAVGRLYGAVTTPHMYVIDPTGTLVYRGALDNRPLGKGGGTTNNFVALALADLAASQPVGTSDTKPYGCSVKYK